MSIRFLNLPATEAWKEMMKERKTSKLKDASGKELDVEELKVIYKLKEDGKGAVLYDFYEEGMEFEGDGIVVPFSSTLKGVIMGVQGTPFVNVKGSSEDLVGGHNGTWISVYAFVTHQPTDHCYTDGKRYEINENHMEEFERVVCENGRGNIAGGHIIIGSNNTESAYPKDNDIVGIVPICKSHNGLKNGYMRLGNNSLIVLLNYTISN